jgi:hypothetical protein
MISKLTWKGHEFVDTIRDSGIWNSVKERLKGLPSGHSVWELRLPLLKPKKDSNCDDGFTEKNEARNGCERED